MGKKAGMQGAAAPWLGSGAVPQVPLPLPPKAASCHMKVVRPVVVWPHSCDE